MPTQNCWNNQVTAAGVTFNGGVTSIGTDAAANAINIGTGGAAKTITIGNGTGATSVIIDCGTGALDIGTNAFARTTTIGNTTGASVLALKCGTGDFTLASATGTIISALDTGEITYPLQSAFLAYQSAALLNATGDGTFVTIVSNTEVFDQNADYNNGTGYFTAPVTGRYLFVASIALQNIPVGINDASYLIVTSNRSNVLWHVNSIATGAVIQYSGSYIGDMDAGDTAYLQCTAGGSTKTVTIYSDGYMYTKFSGSLLC